MAKFSPIKSARGFKAVYGLYQSRRTLLQMIRDRRYRMSTTTLIILVVSIVYILFPFDLLHDYIPILGWIDDGFVLLLLLKRLKSEVQRYNRFKAMERRSPR